MFIYEKNISAMGTFSLRPYSNVDDVKMLHQWVNLDYAKFWMLQGTTVTEVHSAYKDILAEGNTEVYIGCFNGRPVFLLEFYRTLGDPVAKYYDAKGGDYGMHVLVAPADKPLSGFTWNIFVFILEFIFSHNKVERVVVEPDINNKKIHVLNKKAGFSYKEVIEMEHKTAHLAICTRDDFHLAKLAADK